MSDEMLITLVRLLLSIVGGTLLGLGVGVFNGPDWAVFMGGFLGSVTAWGAIR